MPSSASRAKDGIGLPDFQSAMGLITISGEPGCREEEIARLAAQYLHWDLITASRLEQLLNEEFGSRQPIPDKAFAAAALSVLGSLATAYHLVLCVPGAELLAGDFPDALRVGLTASPHVRAGALMVDRRLDRNAAVALLWEIEKDWKAQRKRRFARGANPPHLYDAVFNTETLRSDEIAALVQSVARQVRPEPELLSVSADAELQFRVRLRLAQHKITPAGKAKLKRTAFVHPSEEIFANLLDFYRIAWEYEPKTFPVRWDKDGKPVESFTPDFYLPEFNLYVELTTMKQSLVTKKNRKVKLLKSHYPHINIQVFYEKDIQNLIFKYGLTDRMAEV